MKLKSNVSIITIGLTALILTSGATNAVFRDNGLRAIGFKLNQ